MYLAFIDESGDHVLDPARMDDESNVFVLAAVLFESNKYESFDEQFKNLKTSYFGDSQIILHTKEMTRPARSKDIRNLKFHDPNFRRDFYLEVNALVESIDCKIVACAIRKNLLLLQYGEHADDPYLFCFDNLLNRILFESSGEVKIFPEQRRGGEDNKLEIAFLNAKLSGTKFIRGHVIKLRISEFRIMDKKTNSSGLQLADLIVTPIARNILNKPSRLGNEVLYSVVKEKIPKRGLTVFPQA
jgi:hypothetical protein